MDGLTEQEIYWIRVILESTEAIREQLFEGETPEVTKLYELCNRAEALIWHLAKRDTSHDVVKQVMGL